MFGLWFVCGFHYHNVLLMWMIMFGLWLFVCGFNHQCTSVVDVYVGFIYGQRVALYIAWRKFKFGKNSQRFIYFTSNN